MSEAPSMPMYWDAYLADTTHLTTEEHGAYMLLLAAMWRRNGSVPDDDKDNARILGLSVAKWKRTKVRLSAHPISLIFDNDTISQKKMQKTWQKTQEKIEVNRVNGAKGGRPKSNVPKDLAKANGSVSPNPNVTIPEPEPEPIRGDTNVSLVKPDAGPDEIALALSHFNKVAKGASWPEVRIASPARKSALKQRFKDVGGFDNWCEAIDRAANAPHLTGQNNRGWTADFDWLAKPANFTKLMEGNYDPKTINGNHNGNTSADTTAQQIAFAARAGRSPSEDCL